MCTGLWRGGSKLIVSNEPARQVPNARIPGTSQILEKPRTSPHVPPAYPSSETQDKSLRPVRSLQLPSGHIKASMPRHAPSVPAPTASTTSPPSATNESSLSHSLFSTLPSSAPSHSHPPPPLPLPTAIDPTFSLDAAYRVAARIHALRASAGDIPLGRKIGFTNRTIWTKYNVDAPIWGWVWQSSVHFTDDTTRDPVQPDAQLGKAQVHATLSLSPFHSARIEPEIVFCLSRAPLRGMNPRELVGCIAWVAQGFELVNSAYHTGWTFRAPDAVAAFGLHGALVVGPRVVVSEGEGGGEWAERLAGLKVELVRNGEVVAVGRGEDVLGGPVEALRYLNELLWADEGKGSEGRRLSAGEVVTTGTLTDAMEVRAGEKWWTRVEGVRLPGVRLEFVGGEAAGEEERRRRTRSVL